jgi:hypothetical protein
MVRPGSSLGGEVMVGRRLNFWEPGSRLKRLKHVWWWLIFQNDWLFQNGITTPMKHPPTY